jgi:pyrrolidone-carboxylate peptidase
VYAILILSLLTLCDLAFAADKSQPLVLIAAYEPFMGRIVNASQIVAEQLEQQSQIVGSTFLVKVCTLPVEYKRAAIALQECYLQLSAKPVMVIILGEKLCTTALETRFSNLNDDQFADNAGVLLHQQQIQARGPLRVAATLPLAKMYCAAKTDITVSKNADTFVCNDTAFRMNGFFRKQHVPYGLMHVPKTDCKSFDAKTISKTIANMIAAGLSKSTNRQCEADFKEATRL